MGDMKFVDGLRAYRPSEKAPAHVKCKLQIKRSEFVRWIAAQMPDDGETIRAEICEGKSGNYYARLDEYKPRADSARDDRTPQRPPASLPPAPPRAGANVRTDKPEHAQAQTEPLPF